MIQWPCLFKLEGDDELIFIASETELTKELESLIVSDEDILIDSSGQAFKIEVDSCQGNAFIFQPNALTLEDVTLLVQAHEFSLAQVCLTKIQFNSISEAIEALRS
ncbi:hypothetical protein JCM19240_2602 [Vibrio maritimus]|uniref:Uncharacterized protein n=1 Tax=Vibrio maritimus TaxID=990268 RepID=A0A090TBA7_9VIBR|nr:hypothetical protein JCM19240_2602 [Vibrio maritimus]